MKQSIKPSKSVSKIQFFISFFFLIFGINFLVMAIRTGIGVVTIFSLVWIGLVLFNMYRSFLNAFTDRGMSYYELESSDGNINFEKDLRALERLRDEMLISEEEYQEKRSEIINKKW